MAFNAYTGSASLGVQLMGAGLAAEYQYPPRGIGIFKFLIFANTLYYVR